MLNFCSDISYKQGKFSKILLEKDLEFAPNKKSNVITFNLGLILLPAEINSILEKQSCKKDALIAYSIDCIKIVLILLTKIVTFYI